MAVADGTYAALTLLDRYWRLYNPITFITRLRLAAALSRHRHDVPVNYSVGQNH